MRHRKGVGAAAGGVAGDAITAVAQAIAQAVGQAVKAVATLWVQVPTPNLTTTSGAPSDAVDYLQSHLYYYSGAFAVAALLVAGAKLAIDQRGEGVRQIATLLLRLAVVTGMGVLAIDLAAAAADQFSTWIISQSTNNTDFGANITALLGLTTLTGGAIGAMLVIVLGLVAILASVIQILLMVVRGGMLVMLAGILPTAAAASNFEFGQQWFKKTTAWTLAFILYKPAAAIVYATAFRLAGDNVFSGNGLVSVITGLSLMILALLALPALMRFVVPAVGTLASGSAGGVLAGAGLAAATMPSGALRIGGGGARSAGGSGGGGNGSGPSSNGGGGVAVWLAHARWRRPRDGRHRRRPVHQRQQRLGRWRAELRGRGRRDRPTEPAAAPRAAPPAEAGGGDRGRWRRMPAAPDRARAARGTR